MAKGKKAKEELTPEERLAGALVTVEEQPYSVPGNWCWVILGNLVEICRGASPRPIKSFITDDGTGVNWIKIGDADSGKYIVHTKEKVSEAGVKKSVFVNKGTLLLSNSMSFGRPYILDIDGCIHDGWLAITPSDSFSKEYLYYALIASKWYFQQVAVGTAVRNLNSERVAKTPVPLPPLVEQKRIVDCIERLFAKLDEAKEKAQAVVDGFETRKAAILHKAFTGKLTEQWRKLHPARPNTMLSDIKNFSYNWQKKDQKFLAEEQDKSEIVILDNGHEWVKCTIGAVSRVTNGSTPSRKVHEFWNGTIPWISSGEVKNNIIDSTNECITQKGFDNSSVKLLPIGTVLIAMIGEGKTRGQSSVLNIQATINQNIAAVIIDHGLINSRYIWYWFQMNYAKNREKGSGSGPQALNCQRVRELDFYVPNYTEQNEIVRILDDLLAKEQQAKEAAEAVLDQIETMKKTILARAFRGELGTNDPAEGSAVELLKSVLD